MGRAGGWVDMDDWVGMCVCGRGRGRGRGHKASQESLGIGTVTIVNREEGLFNKTCRAHNVSWATQYLGTWPRYLGSQIHS